MTSNPIEYVTDLLQKEKVAFLVAPSFASLYTYETLLKELRAIGASKILEVTFGAKIVNEQFHKLIPSTDHPWISSTCPTVVSLIKSKFPDYVKYLLPVVSPMHAMAKIALKNYPDHKVVFLSPCIAKRKESDDYAEEVNAVITFAELPTLIETIKDAGNYNENISKNQIHFDSFYNDYTKIYPLTGGLKKSLHYKNILHEDNILVVDGVPDLVKLFSAPLDPKVKFYDVLSCKGGCIGGPCLGTEKTLEEKKKSIESYLKISCEKKVGGTKIGLNKYVEGISFEKSI